LAFQHVNRTASNVSSTVYCIASNVPTAMADGYVIS